MRLTVVAGPDVGQSFSPSQQTIVLGRSSDCDIVLHDRSLTRRHCSIEEPAPGQVLIHDLESANGTFINDSDNRITTHTLALETSIVGLVELPASAGRRGQTVDLRSGPTRFGTSNTRLLCRTRCVC